MNQYCSPDSADMELAAMCDHKNLSSADTIPVATGPRRIVYLLAAGGFFALGVAGILLPGLPTTPFLLLTSYFLLRSSPSLNERLTHSRFLGPILQDWHARRGVRQSVKLRAIALVVIMLAVTIYLGNLPAPLATVVLALGGVGLTVIALLPSISTTNNHATVKTAAITDPVD